MNILILLSQGNYEDLGVKSLLVGAIITLTGAIGYLYKSKEATIKEKDDKILEVIRAHQAEVTTILKETNNDYKQVAEKYYQFTLNIKDLVNNGKSK